MENTAYIAVSEKCNTHIDGGGEGGIFKISPFKFENEEYIAVSEKQGTHNNRVEEIEHFQTCPLRRAKNMKLKKKILKF